MRNLPTMRLTSLSPPAHWSPATRQEADSYLLPGVTDTVRLNLEQHKMMQGKGLREEAPLREGGQRTGSRLHVGTNQ